MLKIAILMDPMEAVGIGGDTTFDLAITAHHRDHEIWVFQPLHLRLDNGRVMARARKVKQLQRVEGDHVDWAEESVLDLGDVDVVLIRQDPPYDMGYL
ncbi:MAG: glutathione synthase, partial [Parvularculaceae bacterium]